MTKSSEFQVYIAGYAFLPEIVERDLGAFIAKTGSEPRFVVRGNPKKAFAAVSKLASKFGSKGVVLLSQRNGLDTYGVL